MSIQMKAVLDMRSGRVLSLTDFFSRGKHINFLLLPLSHSFSTSHLVNCHAHVDSASSTSPNAHLIQQFLEKSCGLSPKSAFLASKPLLNLKSTRIPEQVLKFFKERGFSDAHIQNLVARRPKVLASRVQKTLQPKLRVLEDLGMAGNELGEFICKDPVFFKMSLNKKLLPGVSLLQKMLQSNKNVVKALTRHPRLLHFDLEKNFKPKLLFLQNYGVDEKQLWNCLASKPRFLMSAESVIQNVVKTVEKIGVPTHSRMFIHSLLAVSSMNVKTLERKMNFFMSLGLSHEDLLNAIKKSPYIITVSEEKFEKHMDFLVNTLKYEPSAVVRYPTFFMSSMEARIIPRYRVL